MRAAKEALGNVVAGQIEMVKREFDRRIREERNRERERERKERQGGREGVDGESPTTKVQKQNEGKEDLEQREHT